MLTTIEGVYKHGNIELMETPAGLEEAQVLVTFLPKSVSSPQPQPLYGAWQGRMLADLDVEAALKGIRTAWTLECEPGHNE